MKVLDLSSLQYLWSKIKAKIPTKVSDLTNDSGFMINAVTLKVWAVNDIEHTTPSANE